MDKSDPPPNEGFAEEPAAFSRFASPEEEARFLAAVEEGRADVRAGRVIPIEKVMSWLESWERGQPTERPKCE